MRLFPYEPRPQQEAFVSLVRDTVAGAAHLVLESGTGTGKTVCSLAGALEAGLDEGKRVVYLTRTKSQQRQVIIEAKRMSALRPLLAVGVQGRNSTCPLAAKDEELSKGNSEELSRYCGEQKRKALAGEGGCEHYRAFLSLESDELLALCRERMPQVEEFTSLCAELGACPYEAMKSLLPQADIVVAPYNYFFVPFIRDRFLQWMNCPMEEAVVIIDEAHNLPDYLRDVQTTSLSCHHLKMMRAELEEFGDPEVMNGVSALDVADIVEELIVEAADEHIRDEDGLIPPDLLSSGMMMELRSSSVSLERMYRSLCEHGEVVREARKDKGRLPRSYMLILGSFLLSFAALDERHYVKVVTGGDNPSVQCYCLDPAIAAEPLLNCHASIHMSGTLDPITEYRDSLGLGEGAKARYFKSPFPAGNRLVLHAEDVTTKYEVLQRDRGITLRIQERVADICNQVHRNAAVFFPSYQMMDRFIRDGVLERIEAEVHIERRGMPQAELMETVERFRRADGDVIFAVYGGRISEGLDFPDSDLEMALLVGIPYPRPSARNQALLAYYDMKFGKGWDYVMKAPTLRKMRQAMGRVIRSESDRGAIVVLDSRAASLPPLQSSPSDDILGELRRFFAAAKVNNRAT